MWQGFHGFHKKYKVLGMAVAFIMATYVGLLVQALVDDIIMPLFTYIPGLNNLDRLNDWVVGNFYIGHFLSTSITFIAVAFVIYLIVKIGTKLGGEVEE
ncbi:MAG: MscL family protein [Candidatus Heimdallarchaeota archaeon]|nr:MscL family protein [Candidatus Heimdallarchaeota archaeon]